MLDLYGKQYVIDHCVDSYREEQERKGAIIYITDALFAISGNTAGQPGKQMGKRFYDVLNPPKEETRTPQEVVRHMKDRIKALG